MSILLRLVSARRRSGATALVVAWAAFSAGYLVRTVHVAERGASLLAFTPAVINNGRVQNLPAGDDLNVGTGTVTAGSTTLEDVGATNVVAAQGAVAGNAPSGSQFGVSVTNTVARTPGADPFEEAGVTAVMGGSVDATSQTHYTYGGKFISDTTVSAGAMNQLNIGVYGDAFNGDATGQDNYSGYFDNGDFVVEHDFIFSGVDNKILGPLHVTGAVLFDGGASLGVSVTSANYVYGHLNAQGTGTAGTRPVFSGTCGAGAAFDTFASDFSGTVTMGTTATGPCDINFRNSYTFDPHCVVTAQTAGTVFGYTHNNGQLIITGPTLSGLLFDYTCTGGGQ